MFSMNETRVFFQICKEKLERVKQHRSQLKVKCRRNRTQAYSCRFIEGTLICRRSSFFLQCHDLKKEKKKESKSIIFTIILIVHIKQTRTIFECVCLSDVVRNTSPWRILSKFNDEYEIRQDFGKYENMFLQTNEVCTWDKRSKTYSLSICWYSDRMSLFLNRRTSLSFSVCHAVVFAY